MFIEVTRGYDGQKVLINVHRIDMVEPRKPKDGYGHPQTGCVVTFSYTGNSAAKATRVEESYEQIRSMIEWVNGKAVGTIE